jgi:hypothetical protein
VGAVQDGSQAAGAARDFFYRISLIKNLGFHTLLDPRVLLKVCKEAIVLYVPGSLALALNVM